MIMNQKTLSSHLYSRVRLWVALLALAACCLALALLAAGCGDDDTSSGTQKDSSVSDSSITADASLDAGSSGDAGDSDGAMGEDATTQEDGGVASDAEVSDGGDVDAGHLTCSGEGGQCMPNHWDMCPTGTEPYGDDEALDCNGRCCVPAPGSTCSDDPSHNCLLGTTCEGCWGEAMNSALSCEAGRVCCIYICD